MGLTEPADVVRYRLAVPHLHAFVNTLTADARDGLVAEAIEAVRRTGERFAPVVVEAVARWLSPAGRGHRPERRRRARPPPSHVLGQPRRRGPGVRRSGRVGDVGGEPPALQRGHPGQGVEVGGEQRLVDRRGRAAPARSR